MQPNCFIETGAPFKKFINLISKNFYNVRRVYSFKCKFSSEIYWTSGSSYFTKINLICFEQ